MLANFKRISLGLTRILVGIFLGNPKSSFFGSPSGLVFPTQIPSNILFYSPILCFPPSIFTPRWLLPIFIHSFTIHINIHFFVHSMNFPSQKLQHFNNTIHSWKSPESKFEGPSFQIQWIWMDESSLLLTPYFQLNFLGNARNCIWLGHCHCQIMCSHGNWTHHTLATTSMTHPSSKVSSYSEFAVKLLWRTLAGVPFLSSQWGPDKWMSCDGDESKWWGWRTCYFPKWMNESVGKIHGMWTI
jgi:hypothetical protein